jgi:hypothetical protein
MPVLESKLVIRAEDQTKGAFDAIEAHIKSVSEAVASVNRAVGQTGSYVGAAGRAIGAVGNVGRNAALASRGTGGGLGSSIAAAAAGAGGTFLAARAGEAAVRAIASRQHEQTRMQVAGESPEEVASASVEVAKLATPFPNVSHTDLLHMLRNARSIVGSYKDAADIAEPLVKLRTLAQLARPGEEVSEDFDKLVKGLEIKGVTQNPQQFKEYMDGIAKGINVFGDTLRPYEYYEMRAFVSSRLRVSRPRGRSSRRGASFLASYAVCVTAFREPRQPAKPRPAKPISSIAQVEGSGVATGGAMPL